MRRSRYFLPTLRENPAEAQIASHRLMLRAGMIRQSSAGIYSWLPLGHRVLRKIEQVVREEHERRRLPGDPHAGNPAGRALGGERPLPGLRQGRCLRITDRHDRPMLFGPTHEEVVTDIFRQSRAQLPRPAAEPSTRFMWKFRGRAAPALRHHAWPRVLHEGQLLLRYRPRKRRALLQQDVRILSAHLRPPRPHVDPDAGGERGHRRRLQPRVQSCWRIPARAPSIATAPGSTRTRWRWGSTTRRTFSRSWKSGPGSTPPTDDKHDPGACAVPEDALYQGRGIEVGHIFYFGHQVLQGDGRHGDGPGRCPRSRWRWAPTESASPGSRAQSSKRATTRPALSGRKSRRPSRWGSSTCAWAIRRATGACEALYARLAEAGVEVLYDDRDASGLGVKFAEMELIGLPWQVTVGPRGVKSGTAELKARAGGEAEALSFESVSARPDRRLARAHVLGLRAPRRVYAICAPAGRKASSRSSRRSRLSASSSVSRRSSSSCR